MLLEKAAENLFLCVFFQYGFIVSVFNMWVGASVYWVQTLLARPLHAVLTAVCLLLCVHLLLSVCGAHCCVPHALCPLWPYVVLTAVYLMLCVHFGRMLCSLLCTSCCVSTCFCLQGAVPCWHDPDQQALLWHSQDHPGPWSWVSTVHTGREYRTHTFVGRSIVHTHLWGR